MKVNFKVRGVSIEIDFEMYDGEVIDWFIVKVDDSENEQLKEFFYTFILNKSISIENKEASIILNEIERTIETHNEQIKIERYLDGM